MSQLVKNLPAMQETWIWSLGQEDPLGKGMATHASIFCLENPMDRGTWRATFHGITKSQTWLSDHHRHMHTQSNSTSQALRYVQRWRWYCLYHHVVYILIGVKQKFRWKLTSLMNRECGRTQGGRLPGLRSWGKAQPTPDWHSAW